MAEPAEFKIIASRNLDHDHRNALSLLYLPIIGPQAFSLYFSLYSLIDRSHLKSPSYPTTFLYDILNIQKMAFDHARKTLEAVGLIATHKNNDTLLYELHLPLNADTFIKDALLGEYLHFQIGEARFNDLIQHFKITRTRLKDFENISASFSDIFKPLYKDVPTKSNYLECKTKAPTLTTNFDTTLLIESLPEHLVHDTTKTKAVKERLKQIAYIYNLDEITMKALILKALNQDTSINFESLTKHAQSLYQDQPKNKFTKKSSGYDLEYFKSTHPKTIVEDLTGANVPGSDLKIIERLITQSDVPLEVLNVLVAYVLKELDNQFPVFNYFEKVVAEWKRNNIKTAEDAIAHIKKRKQQKNKPKKSHNYKSKTLPTDVEVDWLSDYIKENEKEH